MQAFQLTNQEVRVRILAAYHICEWNTTRTARWLGIHRRTLMRWVIRLNLRKEIERERERREKNNVD